MLVAHGLNLAEQGFWPVECKIESDLRNGVNTRLLNV